MNKFVSIGLGAAAVIAVLLIGSRLIGSPTSSVGGPASQPPASAAPSGAPPSAATESAAPSPASPPPLTQSFTSTQHGISMSFPHGWIARAATEPWTDLQNVGRNGHGRAQFEDPAYDMLGGDNEFLYFASLPIGDSAPEDWIAALMASCTTTEPITVDGATGLIGSRSDGCFNDTAAVTIDGRGYWISLYTPTDDPSVAAVYDRAWFEQILATVRLHPEDAVDAKPSPSP